MGLPTLPRIEGGANNRLTEAGSHCTDLGAAQHSVPASSFSLCMRAHQGGALGELRYA
jgi:hypothetical protein